jgi:ufm1-conjugating enzyme 1
MSLIKYIQYNKNDDNDWVKIEATNKEQTKYYICVIRIRWKGKCHYIHNLVRYDFDLQFEVYS